LLHLGAEATCLIRVVLALGGHLRGNGFPPLHLGAEAASVRIGTKALPLGFGEFAFELFNLAGSPPLPFIFWHATIQYLLA
jgi:hypothetical protein